VRVLDADVAPELDEAPFLVMELLTGQDFERICLERKPSATEVLDWLRQLGIALDKAHGEGIVHRDLKPENVFLAEREGLPPIVKVLDFGIAKVSTEGAGGSTATGQILGTPRYMAPEQAVGAKEVTPAADRFAMGLIAFRLLCGGHYFTGENWVGLLRDVARGPTARPSELGSNRGPAFDAWFARACAQAPKDRFATCAEQVEALGQALAGVSMPGTGWRRARRWVALGAVGAAAAIVWAVGHRNAVAPPRAVAGATAPGASSSTPPAPPVATPPAAVPAVAPPAVPSVAAEPATEPRQSSRDSSGEHRIRHRPAQPTKAAAAVPATPRDPVWDEP
jgi:eukaryotic-like serine/threonine-protein kinase